MLTESGTSAQSTRSGLLTQAHPFLPGNQQKEKAACFRLMDSIGFPMFLSIVMVGPKGYFRALLGY